jgi:YD repeat-containing protein
MKHICFALLLILSLFGCQDHIAPLTPGTCKLAAIDRGNGNKHAYTYDASGRVSQMTRDFDGTGSGKIARYVYTFTFDAAGLLTKSTWTLDGKPNGSETYTYTAGRISKVNYANADGSSGTNTIKYNPAGQITEFTYDDGDPANFFRGYFEYNADGITTKLGYDDGQGNVFYEVVYKPVGNVTAPEALLAKSGLPYDVLSGVSWQVAVGDVGSTYEEFTPDAKTGKLVSTGTGKTTAVKTNANRYLTESIILDNTTNTSTTQTFTLAGCN